MLKLSYRLSLALTLLITLALTGCGYKGPLTLPEPPAVSDTDANP